MDGIDTRNVPGWRSFSGILDNFKKNIVNNDKS